ncbi:hypothetical protein Glove_283g142 [Diversispora epigaea]|uniref:Zn(2)-C6 fungal-type domain-containing protein n=1 Tax=Diversispora epigaea TaxID=1348612 RepID=A0A397I1R5_9GLOM|nr:hypothetical protein Glove_283g142 [Diversispora epigaea]
MFKRKEYTKNACTSCANAKRKCEWKITEEKCTRCKFLSRICTLRIQKKRGRKHKKDNFQIQEQNDIYSFDQNYKFNESEAPVSYAFQL